MGMCLFDDYLFDPFIADIMYIVDKMKQSVKERFHRRKCHLVSRFVIDIGYDMADTICIALRPKIFTISNGLRHHEDFQTWVVYYTNQINFWTTLSA